MYQCISASVYVFMHVCMFHQVNVFLNEPDVTPQCVGELLLSSSPYLFVCSVPCLCMQSAYIVRILRGVSKAKVAVAQKKKKNMYDPAPGWRCGVWLQSGCAVMRLVCFATGLVGQIFNYYQLL